MPADVRKRPFLRKAAPFLFPFLLNLPALVPGASFAGGPAPDTVGAGSAISRELESAGGDPKAAARESQQDGCGRYVSGLRVLYERAGYDFDATALEIPEFLRRSGDRDISGREMTGWTMTALLIAGIRAECPGGSESYGKHFDARTAAAISEVLGQAR